MTEQASPADWSRLRVLIVEDRPLDAELMLIRLEDEGFDLDWRRVDNAKDYLDALADPPDLILSDWHLPSFSGAEALRLLHRAELDLPFIIVSGSVGEERAIDAIRRGADDYILKDRLARIGSSIKRSMAAKVARDEQRQSDIALRQAATIFSSSAEGILLTDAAGVILTVNPAFCAITGYTADEAVGWDTHLLTSERQPPSYFQNMWDQVNANGQWRGEIWNRRRNGESYPQWLNLSSVTDSAGVITNYVGTFSDLSTVREAQDAAAFLASHDPLTGLPNRRLFRESLQQQLHRNGAPPTDGPEPPADRIAVLHVDLDRFKQINESLGHHGGDAVLQQYASRIGEIVGSNDIVARLGGDDFVVLTKLDTESKADDESQSAAQLARRLIDAATTSIRVAGREIAPTASIGLSLYPRDGIDADALLQNAERAMYEAKASGRNTYQFFDPALNAGIQERLDLEHALRGAADRGELRLHYQPQLDMITSSLSGLEALVRWQHPSLGLISPLTFIPLAEELGIVSTIGQWVLEESCRQLAEWHGRGFEVPRIAVNLSVQELQQPNLVTGIAEALDRHRLSPHRIECEVTESMMMREPEEGLRTLNGLRELGVGLSMDDFGTGYSSLSHLKRLPLTALKIDISFVRDIGLDPNGEAIIRMIIALADNMGIETIAEGIEEKRQLGFLRAEGCRTGQGFLFSRPLTASALYSEWAVHPGT